MSNPFWKSPGNNLEIGHVERGSNRIEYYPMLIAGQGECWLVGVENLSTHTILFEVKRYGDDAWKLKAITIARFVDGVCDWQGRIFLENLLAICEHPDEFELVAEEDEEKTFSFPDSVRMKIRDALREYPLWYRYAVESNKE